MVFMIHKEEGGGGPQIKVDIQRRLIVHVTMHVIAPTQTNILRTDKSIAHKVICLANRYRNTDQYHNILILPWIF